VLNRLREAFHERLIASN
jgi:hypothetical protein